MSNNSKVWYFFGGPITKFFVLDSAEIDGTVFLSKKYSGLFELSY